MKRKLTVQIKNEWRPNAWLVIEMIVIGVVMWLVFCLLFSIVRARIIPTGYVYGSGVYEVNYASVSDKSKKFVPDRNDGEDVDEIIRRLREMPQVEAVGRSAMNGIPHNYNYFGRYFHLMRMGADDSVKAGANAIEVTPEFMDVVSFEGIAGETPQQLKAVLESGKVIVSENVLADTMPDYDAKKLPSEWFYRNGGDYRIGAVVRAIKRNDYEPPRGATVIMPKLNYSKGDRIAIKLKPGSEAEARQFIKENADKLFHVGNMYVKGLTSIEQLREYNQLDIMHTVYTTVFCLLFLSVSIFMGLLGTFWFRTQQRVSEIAIRMVNGATPMAVLRRLMSEGLLLLLVSSPFSLGIELLLWHYDVVMLEWGELDMPLFVVTSVATFALLALMIALGIWFPARKAMHVNPAEIMNNE